MEALFENLIVSAGFFDAFLETKDRFFLSEAIKSFFKFLAPVWFSTLGFGVGVFFLFTNLREIFEPPFVVISLIGGCFCLLRERHFSSRCLVEN